MTNDAIQAIIRRQSQSLDLLPTGKQPILHPLTGIKAVLFDVYGTLFISASGDIGSTHLESRDSSFSAALQEVGLDYDGSDEQGDERIVVAIRRRHDQLHAAGVEFPEVDILDVWREVLEKLLEDGLIDHMLPDPGKVQQLSVEYEVRTNPVCPMPGCEETLDVLRKAGLHLGLISNAQFYTPDLFGSLLSRAVHELGFHERLQFYSYRFGEAKPGRFLYERARDVLRELGIAPAEVVYVGNDMLKDIAPAAASGFRTALFAGDARSLRLRVDDPRVEGVVADLVLTDLAQLPACVLGPTFSR